MKGTKVLLVDDEVEFVTTLAERLQLRGIEATTTTDGESALKLLGKDPPKVVVLDVLMPGLSGMEVLRQIKATHPHIPVILLTGQGSTQDGVEGKRLGAFDYLVKPLNIDELMEKMREAIKGL